MYPCYNTSYSEIFRLFKESNVDISYSNRMNIKHISGAAVLSKWGPRSHHFWMESVKLMKRQRMYDDQGSAYQMLFNRKHEGFTFRLMSSNWFFASHGIDKTGKFIGSENCYRSSVVVTGPVQWIHGDLRECTIMNGEHDEKIYKRRVYYKRGNCESGAPPGVEITTAHSESELKLLVGNNALPKLQWEDQGKQDKDSLFWDF